MRQARLRSTPIRAVLVVEQPPGIRIRTVVAATVVAWLTVAAVANRAEAQERQAARPLFSTGESEEALTREVGSPPFDRLFIVEPLPRPPSALSVLTPPQDPAQPPPKPGHTGFQAFIRTTGADFKAFPRRRSTWVILAIGAGAAAASHPVDDEVNARLVGSPAVGRLFAPGKWIGSVYVQAGTAAGLYVIGRYILPRTEGEPKTNKVSHLGFDLLRGVIVSQALTQGIKIAVRRDRPTGECCAFPSGHASAAFATASIQIGRAHV